MGDIPGCCLEQIIKNQEKKKSLQDNTTHIRGNYFTDTEKAQ